MKVNYSPLASLTNQTSAINTINSNFAAVQTAMEKTLSRDGTSPNTMSASIDMNSHTVYNISTPVSDTQAATKKYVDDVLINISGSGFVGPGSVSSGSIAVFNGTTGQAVKAADVFYSPKAFGAAGDGVTDDYIPFSACITAAAAAGAVVYIGPGTYLLGTSFSLSTPLLFMGGILKPANGVTLTLTGNSDLDAPSYKIFDLSLGGVVAGNPRLKENCIYSEWWGAIPDGSTDCTPSFTYALAFLKQYIRGDRKGGTLQLLTGLYKVVSGFTIDFPSCHIQGRGKFATTINMTTGTYTLFSVVGSTDGSKAYYDFKASNLTIDSGVAKPTSGQMIAMYLSGQSEVSDCAFLNYYQAIVLENCQGPLSKKIHNNDFVAPASAPAIAGSVAIFLRGETAGPGTRVTENASLINNTGGGIGAQYGVYINGCDTLKMTNNHIHGAAVSALYIVGLTEVPIYNIQSTGNTWEALDGFGTYACLIQSSLSGTIDFMDDIFFTGDQFLNGTTACIYVGGTRPHGVSFINCNIKGCNGYGLWINGATSVNTVGCIFMEGNLSNVVPGAWVVIGDGSTNPTDVLVSNCIAEQYALSHTMHFGVWTRSGTKIKLSNLILRDWSTAAIYNDGVAANNLSILNCDTGVLENTTASATTIEIPLGCDRINITGTTTITTIDDTTLNGSSAFDGREVELIFASTPTISHGVGNILLGSKASYTNTAGDRLRLRYESVNSRWREIGRSYIPASGGPFASLSLSTGANADIALAEDARFYRITGPGGAFSISGFTGGYDGRILTVYNTTSNAMTITNDASSTAANRILSLSGADIVTTGAGGNSATFVYSSTDSRWILLSVQA